MYNFSRTQPDAEVLIAQWVVLHHSSTVDCKTEKKKIDCPPVAVVVSIESVKLLSNCDCWSVECVFSGVFSGPLRLANCIRCSQKLVGGL